MFLMVVYYFLIAHVYSVILYLVALATCLLDTVQVVSWYTIMITVATD